MEELRKELPNKESAFIEEEKLGYLFRGKNKGGYFLGLGFSEEAPELLSPDGRNPPTRTIWQIDRGNWRPRLVTAYPV